MVHDDTLSQVLSDFARTMATDFPIQAILDHLVEQIVDILPITAAGVTLISDGRAPHYVAASGPEALRFEQIQTDSGQGPCLTAFASGDPVVVADLTREARWPVFTSVALAQGMAAVFAFPMRHGDGRLGALDLYRDTTGPLDARDVRAAQTLADVATAYLLNARAREVARQNSDEFEHHALHDPLTGLANRTTLQHRLDAAGERAAATGSCTAVLFVDLDRFKLVNDTYGHQVGDELLYAVGVRLAALVRPGDTLARVSGDEFVFLYEGLHDAGDVVGLATRVEAAFRNPFVLGNATVSVTASVGAAVAAAHEDVSRELVVRADAAMYQAKRAGGARHRWVDKRVTRRGGERDDLDRDLRAALADDGLDLAYQPVVTTKDGRLVGLEALLRWQHPTRGTVPALSMVRTAEQSGLIGPLGAWVLERACAQREKWQRSHPSRPLDLAVNVSARQLLDPAFVGTVHDVMSRTAMDPRSLVLEVTENVLVEDTVAVTAVLTGLRSMGVRLALDDFGTGFSSLSYLRRLPIDIVKIDQAFVADVDDDQAGAGFEIVAAVTNLAHVLGHVVTAEGVETHAQRDAVAAVGCDLAQGQYYSRPLSAADVAIRLDQLEQDRPMPSGTRLVS